MNYSGFQLFLTVIFLQTLAVAGAYFFLGKRLRIFEPESGVGLNEAVRITVFRLPVGGNVLPISQPRIQSPLNFSIGSQSTFVVSSTGSGSTITRPKFENGRIEVFA